MDLAAPLTEDATEPVSRPEPDGVGAFLRTRRVALGLSHADVGNAVKASARRIEALEEERWHELPDGPFLRGFLRNVARALDLDAVSLTERVDESLMRVRNPESILVLPPSPHGMLPRRSGPLDDRHGGRKLIFGAFVFAVIAALIAWSGTDSFERMLTAGRALVQRSPATAPQPQETVPAVAIAPVEVPKTGDATTAAVTPAAPTSAPAPADAGVPAANATGLSFHFNEESWVEVRSADGRVLMTGLNPAGSDQQVDGQTPLLLVVGNAKGVALRYRGQVVDLVPYTRDQVARFTLP